MGFMPGRRRCRDYFLDHGDEPDPFAPEKLEREREREKRNTTHPIFMIICVKIHDMVAS
jgi:hypothetical protein